MSTSSTSGFDLREAVDHLRDTFGPAFAGHAERMAGRMAGRMGRGDIRSAVLVELAEQPMHGYQLMQAIAERSGGRWTPSPGAIYPTISQLEDEGLVTVTADAGRKLVTLTDAGREHIAGQEQGLYRGIAAHEFRQRTATVFQALVHFQHHRRIDLDARHAQPFEKPVAPLAQALVTADGKTRKTKPAISPR